MTASEPNQAYTEAYLIARATMPPGLHDRLEEAERVERSGEYADEPPRWVRVRLALGSRGTARFPLRPGDWVQLIDEKRPYPPSGRVVGWTKTGTRPGKWHVQVVWSEGALVKHAELHDARELTHMDKDRVGMLWQIEISPYQMKEQLRQLDEALYGPEGAPE
ncbi:hypothetical protein [Streptomyces sp. NPDC048638]|uniref:hypothetical protein n=1 Tax=Streptomyces sp. NPDC048638 TaxID=3365580 RepID=UPI0037167674